MLRALAARRRARRLAGLTLGAARARAARGAALLDEGDPGWAARIDTAALRLGDGRACILGQLHGEYRRGLGRARVLDLSSAPRRFVSPVDLGFQAVGDLGEAAEALDYALLTRAWRDEVAARGSRGGAGPGRAPEDGLKRGGAARSCPLPDRCPEADETGRAGSRVNRP